jgi:imidazolonepropionase-like amidohydrolase
MKMIMTNYRPINWYALFCLLLVITPAFHSSKVPAQQAEENLIAIVGATVVDGTGAEAIQANLLIRGERIAAVGANIEIPANARVIRAEGQTLIPGLFDLHTHLSSATGGGGVSADWPKHLKAYLYCGVTSVVDFGTYPETFEPMRRLIKSGVVIAPRLSLAARMSTPGGHGAEGGRGDFFTLEVSTPTEARAAVRRWVAYNPDVIKVFTDGWRYGAASDMTSMNEDVLAAIVDEAHKNGIEVLTHTVSLEKAKIAARAGVDVIAHGIGNADVDDELIQLMKKSGTSYAPTLAVYEQRSRNITSLLLETVLDGVVKEAMKAAEANAAINPPAGNRNPAGAAQSPQARRWQYLMRNTAALRKSGINFGNGTDSGITGTHHGWASLREMQLLVAGGLTPLEAITAATGNSAKAIKVDAERGTIAVGKLADMVLIEGAPHKNIADIERIKRVFLGGRELEREQLATEIATLKLSSIPAIKAKEMIDDFERADGRSQIDTLWVNNTDSGHDHSESIFGRTLRDASNHALSVMTRMSDVQRPYVRLNIPLSRGAIEPVDASSFRGVRFDVRGEGDYRFLIPTREIRNSPYYQTSFKAVGQWQTVRIDFASLKQEGAKSSTAWTGKDLLMLSFEISRKSGELGWLELDNIRFYK